MHRCPHCLSHSNYNCCSKKDSPPPVYITPAFSYGGNIPVVLEESFDGENLLKETIPMEESIRSERIIRSMTLPIDSAERKNYPLLSGCLKYFPAALAGVANISKKGNDKHNKGLPLHHDRNKSMDHGDCVIRHLIDTEDLLAKIERGEPVTNEEILTEVNQLAWRVLAYSQNIHERLGSPLAPGAVVSDES